MITSVPRKVIGQNPQPSNTNVLDRKETIKDTTDKTPIQRTNSLKPKDVYKDTNSKKDATTTGAAAEGKTSEAKDDNKIKNGPHPAEGI